MRKYLLFLVTLFFILSFRNADDDKKAFKKLYALEGVWVMAGKKATVYEEWKMVSKNYLQNKGYTMKGSDTLISERVKLKKTKDGIYYTSTVENQNNKKPIAFKLTSAEGNLFIFENKEHDFPKRIVYQLISADSLHAFIDDGVKGTKKAQHFYYVKQKKQANGL